MVLVSRALLFSLFSNYYVSISSAFSFPCYPIIALKSRLLLVFFFHLITTLVYGKLLVFPVIQLLHYYIVDS